MLPSARAGYTTCYHTRALSQVVSDADLKLLLCSKQPSGMGPTWDGASPFYPRLRVGDHGPQVGGVGNGSPAGLEDGGGGAWTHPATHTHSPPREQGPPPPAQGWGCL